MSEIPAVPGWKARVQTGDAQLISFFLIDDLTKHLLTRFQIVKTRLLNDRYANKGIILKSLTLDKTMAFSSFEKNLTKTETIPTSSCFSKYLYDFVLRSCLIVNIFLASACPFSAALVSQYDACSSDCFIPRPA